MAASRSCRRTTSGSGALSAAIAPALASNPTKNSTRMHASIFRELLEIAASGRYAMRTRSEEHASELQSLMRTSYAVFCLKKKKKETHDIYRQLLHTHTYTKQNTQIRYQ